MYHGISKPNIVVANYWPIFISIQQINTPQILYNILCKQMELKNPKSNFIYEYNRKYYVRQPNP